MSCCLQEAAQQQQQPDFALCLLRVIFTSTTMPESPLLSALTEDTVLGLLLRQQGSSGQTTTNLDASNIGTTSGELMTSQHSSREGLERQGSYTEVALATPIPTDTVRPQTQCAVTTGWQA